MGSSPPLASLSPSSLLPPFPSPPPSLPLFPFSSPSVEPCLLPFRLLTSLWEDLISSYTNHKDANLCLSFFCAWCSLTHSFNFFASDPVASLDSDLDPATRGSADAELRPTRAEKKKYGTCEAGNYLVGDFGWRKIDVFFFFVYLDACVHFVLFLRWDLESVEVEVTNACHSLRLLNHHRLAQCTLHKTAILLFLRFFYLFHLINLNFINYIRLKPKFNFLPKLM